jgi:hypothetical protein
VIFLGQLYAEPKDTSGANQNNDTVTPTPISTPTVQPTLTPSIVPTLQENVKIDSVSIDNSSAASVSANSQSEQDIIITKIILKDASGNTLASDDSINQRLPADGTPTKITINQYNADFDLCGTFTLTIVTSKGNSFTTQSCSPAFY